MSKAALKSNATLSSSIADQIAAANADEANLEVPVVTAVPEVPVPVGPVPAPVAAPKVTTVSPSIRKGKPLPDAAKRSRASVYPWATMEVDDSFFVAGAKIESFWSMCNQRNKAAADAGLTVRFKACRDTEDGVNGVGVWRIA